MTNRLTAGEIASMRAEVVNVQLDHTCTVQRKTNGAVDPNNNPTFTWGAHLTAACHYWTTSERELMGMTNAVITREGVVFAANTDVTERDRISSVLDNDGQELLTAARDIEQAVQELNQVVVKLRGVE